MANDLTGDFDVVAEFTLSAANRVLAAMHSVNRFPHSWSLRVDDVFQSKRTARSIVDVNGDPLTDPAWVNAVALAPSALRGITAAEPIFQKVDPLINVSDSHALGPADQNHLRGVAQVQFGPPTLTVPDDSGASVVTHTPVMARYFPDPGAMDIPEYLHGDIEITFGAHESIGQAGTFIDVNLGAVGNIRFNPSAPLPPPQLAAINKALRNSLVNSFQPSSTPLPSGILNMQFKTMPPDSPALAVLINLPGGAYAAGGLEPDPGDVSSVFLRNGDDFAFAAGSDFVQAMIAPSLESLKAHPRKLSFDWVITIPNPFGDDIVLSRTTITYTVSINSIRVDLQDPAPGYLNGRFLISVTGSANTPTILPDIDFNGSQALTLTITGDQDSVDLVADGDPFVDPHAPGVVPDWVINNYFKPFVVAEIKNEVASYLNQLNPGLEQKMSAYQNLGRFLTPLMNPVPKPGAAPEQEVDPQLAYTSWEIRSTGVILHGTLQVPAWPPAHVEFASRTYSVSTRRTFGWVTEYSALKSWIPGGAITEFIWNLRDGPQLGDDHNKFVLPNAQVGLRHLCLTIKGNRISATDPVAQEGVTATLCAWSIPIDAAGGLVKSEGATGRPMVALPQLADSGALEVVGHTSLWAPAGASPGGVANLIVHFPDNRTVAELDFLSRALRESGRTDAAAGIVAVLTPGQLAKIKPVDGIMFADDDDAWAHLLGVKGRPATFVIDTSGKVVWHDEGELTSADLAGPLKTHLVAGSSSRPRLLQLGLRMGQPSPNFLFESASGQQLTLRKLARRPVVLVFWMSSSPASLETLRDLQKALAGAGNQGPVVLAINDGEASEVARRVVAENGLSAIVVPDPRQDISSAYGVNIWPTTIFLDDRGMVSNIRYGRFAAELAAYASQAKRAGA